MPATHRPGKGDNVDTEEEAPVAGAGRSVQAAVGANTAGGPREGKAQQNVFCRGGSLQVACGLCASPLEQAAIFPLEQVAQRRFLLRGQELCQPAILSLKPFLILPQDRSKICSDRLLLEQWTCETSRSTFLPCSGTFALMSARPPRSSLCPSCKSTPRLRGTSPARGCQHHVDSPRL